MVTVDSVYAELIKLNLHNFTNQKKIELEQYLMSFGVTQIAVTIEQARVLKMAFKEIIKIIGIFN